jgi:hypothetical protein
MMRHRDELHDMHFSYPITVRCAYLFLKSRFGLVFSWYLWIIPVISDYLRQCSS